MTNQHTPDGQFHSLRNWQQGPGEPVPLSTGQQVQQGPQASTHGTYQNYGPGQYPGMPNSNQQYNAPAQSAVPGGPNYGPTIAQPPFGSGTYQQYSTTPAPGPQYPGGQYSPQYAGQPAQTPYQGAPNQQYTTGPAQPPYQNAPNQQYTTGPAQPPYQGAPNQQYATGPVQPPYQGAPDQSYGPPAQPPFGSGTYQQYGSVPGPGVVQPQYAGPPNQAYGPPVQTPFYPAQAGNPPYQPYPQGPKKRGNSWKALFFIVPVVIVIIASIFGPAVLHNVSQGKPPLTAIHLPLQPTAVTLTQQQLQALQQSDEHMHYKQLANLYVSQMTLDEKIGQLMVVTYGSDNYSQDLDYMLNQQHVGGVIMYQLSVQHQLQTAYQVKHDIALMQQRATFPLFISIDEEGWNVDRLGHLYPVPPNPKRLAADDIHKTGDPAVASSEGQRVAHDMMAMGINVNFAPDVDVALNQGYIDWDYRAFGQNPDDVIKYAAPYLEAMQAGGVIGGLKHFVGLGAVPRGNTYDPHFVLPSVDLTPEQINTHMMTFKHFIDSPNKLDHPGFIMPTDLMVPSIDPKYPTEFSHTFITDILRHKLSYDGVVITDGLQMGGVKLNGQTLTEAYASVLALQAGCDMLLDIAGSDQAASVITAVKAALKDGTLTQARIDEAVTRILTLKMERNVVPSIQGINMTA
ncbi:MAG: hypothetical protein NVS2B12_18000 [Ktedonobacteraceae bacterium]